MLVCFYCPFAAAAHTTNRGIIKMTIVVIFSFTLLCITTWTLSAAKYTPQSAGGSAVCAVGEALDLIQTLEANESGSCVPLSVRCAFTCQQNAPNCTSFNYYSDECCRFFSGSIVDFAYQQGCTLWAVGHWENQFALRNKIISCLELPVSEWNAN